jgi:hypothetical protein
MAGEKKNNMATRFADERINSMEAQIRIYRDEAHTYANKAKVLRAQAEALELEIVSTRNSLEQCNYENGNGNGKGETE